MDTRYCGWSAIVFIQKLRPPGDSLAAAFCLLCAPLMFAGAVTIFDLDDDLLWWCVFGVERGEKEDEIRNQESDGH